MLFFDGLQKTIKTGAEPDMKAFEKERAAFDWKWVNTTQNEQRFNPQPEGNTFAVCLDIYKKWAAYL